MATVRNQQTGHEVPLSTEERRNDNKVSIEKGESGGRFVGLTESFFRPDAWQQEYRNPTLQPTAAGTDRPLWDEQMVTENVPPIEVKTKNIGKSHAGSTQTIHYPNIYLGKWDQARSSRSRSIHIESL